MDDLLRDFLTESAEHLDTIDAELVRFEREPTNADALRHIFRLVRTIKGTCGFLGLPRLGALAHAAETLMGCLRDGAAPTPEAVTAILSTVDRLKDILAALGADGVEPEGDDATLVVTLERMAQAAVAAPPASLPAMEAGTSWEGVVGELEANFRAAPQGEALRRSPGILLQPGEARGQGPGAHRAHRVLAAAGLAASPACLGLMTGREARQYPYQPDVTP